MNKKEIEAKLENVHEEFRYQGFGDTLSDVIYIGNNFIVNAKDGNSNGVDFYLLSCIVCKQCATHNIVDAWENVVFIGTFYIEGTFFNKCSFIGMLLNYIT